MNIDSNYSIYRVVPGRRINEMLPKYKRRNKTNDEDDNLRDKSGQKDRTKGVKIDKYV